jgi:hypothetical protein
MDILRFQKLTRHLEGVKDRVTFAPESATMAESDELYQARFQW